METQKNIIKAAIDYLSIYANKSENFNNFKYIGLSIDNPLKVSYINQDKINSLLEYTNTKILGTKEQRKKYFTRTTISKLLSSMFTDEREKTETIAADIDKQLRINYCKNVELFIENDLSGFYSQNNENYIYSACGSCMDKKNKNFFDIYKNFINIDTKIVGLKVGRSVVARAILWEKTKIHKKDVDQYDKDNNKTTFQIETQEKKYFLDRIYISKTFENSNKAELQSQLFNKVKRALKLKTLDCASLIHIKQYLDDKYNILKFSNNFKYHKKRPEFTIQINQDLFHGLENYPYLDTFRYGIELNENIKFSYEEEGANFILDDTSGSFTEGYLSYCDSCGEPTHEDDLCYSNTEDEYLCCDCNIYISERDDVVRSENAIYNNYTCEYHYSEDLDY